jgi:hypothetical protein
MWSALQDAASVAGLLITTEAAVAEAPQKLEAGANATMAAERRISATRNRLTKRPHGRRSQELFPMRVQRT